MQQQILNQLDIQISCLTEQQSIGIATVEKRTFTLTNDGAYKITTFGCMVPKNLLQYIRKNFLFQK